MNEDILMVSEREAGAPESIPALGIGWFTKPLQNAKKTKESGHPVFEDREWICIVVPGDKNSRIERPASERDKQRFPNSYAGFLRRENKAPIEGWAIEEWPVVSRALAMTLKAANIPTVEALAGVSDTHIDKISGGRELRSKAQAVIAQAKDAAVTQQYKADNDRLMAMIVDQQKQIQELAAKLQEPKRGPGRPRKQPEQPAAA